jgi:hypothetical protein
VERVHPSRVDWWLALVAWGDTVLPVVLGAGMFVAGERAGGLVVAGISVATIVGVMLGLAWPVRYIFRNGDLWISSGWWLRWRIPVQAIEGVEPSRWILGSPAWFIDRLAIHYRQRKSLNLMLVSPRDTRLFLEDILERNPALELHDHRLSVR